MPGPTSVEARKRAAARTFEWWSETVLADPGSFSKLKVERYRKGIDQRTLAASADIHPHSLSALERGGKPKKATTRQALADALSVKPKDIFDE
jgi:DNA-binding XRE family transcriptional regulator